ncbi:MAG: GTP-dependent dephospho-CoA kinase family protein [Candidatus Saliniplasma sp.]
MYNNDNLPDVDLKLPENLRTSLKKTVGELVSGKLPKRYTDNDCIITVGDVVTEIIYGQGIIPDLAVIDGKTKRGDYEVKYLLDEKTINIKNPAEIIKSEAWQSIQNGLDCDEPVIIKVDGEEDLLSLVAIALAEKDCLVIYGIPDEGMVINIIDDDIKVKSWEVINNMVKVNED